MTKYKVKLDAKNLAQPNQNIGGYLAAFGQVQIYPKKDAIKKAKLFWGQIEPIEERQFFYQDKTGRGFTGNFDYSDIITGEEEESDNEETIKQWAEDASAGDVFENRTMKITCL